MIPGNNGFFGAMALPQGANSFIPQEQLTGPQGFTSPPMSDKLLAALKQLSNLAGGMGTTGQAPAGGTALPPNSVSPFMPGAGGQQGAAPGGMGGFDPEQFRKLMAMILKMPGNGTGIAGQGSPAMPGGM